MQQRDLTNSQFQLAVDFITQTAKPLFLTGKAGTGKTTFLRYIREHSPKNTVVLAPTGVAAINAGGTTLHSFFNLPFGPFIPGPGSHFTGDNNQQNDRHSLLSRMRIRKEKREMFRQIELMIIDEISMVRCDILDAIDTILRHFRHNPSQPFGGVQTLFIGDMHQLPPVIPDAEWEMLKHHYTSPFFFDSKVVQQQPPLYIELEKIYRQSDQTFIDVLNKVRNNQLDNEGLNLLETRYQPSFDSLKQNDYILLTTHNYKADTTNNEALKKLPGKLHSFEATVTGEFSEKAYPADKNLQLKVNAQVMFIKNDMEKIRRFFNGKLGVVTKIEDDYIYVKCADLDEPIRLSREEWKNIKYTLHPEKQKVEEEEVGSFSQFPLRLAWAITIHKSQGLTFEKAVIDAGSAFAAGQVYVALSRCTSLEGLVLKSRINPGSIISDERITTFSKQKVSEQELAPVLQAGKKTYQSSLLHSLFNLDEIILQANRVNKIIKDNSAAFSPDGLTWGAQLQKQCFALKDIAFKFELELTTLLDADVIPEYNEALQPRLIAAVAYFIKQLEEVLLPFLRTDTPRPVIKEITTSFKETLQELYSAIRNQLMYFARCKEGFSMEKWLERPSSTYPEYFTSYANPRETTSRQEKQSSSAEKKKPAKESRGPKINTRHETFVLFRAGKSVDEIAETRAISPRTVEEHLVGFIAIGELPVQEFVTEEKLAVILPHVQASENKFLSPIKEMLGDGFSYLEIKAVVQHEKWLNSMK